MLIRHPILVTTGDPEGVGPDLTESISQNSYNHPFVIIGEQKYIPHTFPIISRKEIIEQEKLPEFSLLEPLLPAQHAASFAYLELALSLLDDGHGAALLTGPIDKKKWLDSGIPYKGHTELFQARYNRNAIMFFWSDKLKIALYTVHRPLSSVASTLSVSGICTFLDTLIPELNLFFDKPCHIMLAGLNPHAGEMGIMGNEETDCIIPAINIARTRHPNEISGPYPPDTLFHAIRNEENIVVVCWYHDQGLIPFKLLHFHEGVNVTLGLPFLRTSPDHGTAQPLKGTDMINPGSMLAAAALADRWATNKKKYQI